MEPLNQKSLERVVSQKAFQMSNSFSCKFCVVGFLCGVCLTSLFLAAFTSLGGGGGGGGRAVSLFSNLNSTSVSISGKCVKVTEKIIHSDKIEEEKVSLLYSTWSDLISNKSIESYHKSNTARPPHLENCKSSVSLNKRLDSGRVEGNGNGNFRPWKIWNGTFLDNNITMSQGEGDYYPPWITGSDSENYPMTRKVQRDIWLHQHPTNCNTDPSVKFLLADWERLPGFGMGAQIAGMSGILAIAINQNRVLVTDYYNRADHSGCKGSSRSSWSCYFFLETSLECKKRAFELKGDKVAWEKGIITGKDNYTSRDIWFGRIPRRWGNPWSNMRPTTEINGTLIGHHRKMDHRWWRAQAFRYLVRFQSEYTCNLMNLARHDAFGWEAAKMVVASSSSVQQDDIQEVEGENNRMSYDIDKYVWSYHKPWIPRPLLSMHVRMGDKECEMKLFGFEQYMHLGERIRNRFPHLNTIWLSTEMQDVIDRSKSYGHWKFYYTRVRRQTGNTSMASYESSLGRETSTNYPLVNLLMATEADFFVGALGSSWCFLIDGMRNTGGKVMAGYLSVNKDRFW